MYFRIEFTDQAKEDIASYKKSGNKVALNKILVLLEELKVNPFDGTGKPEPLKHDLTGVWSRRINKNDRPVYQVMDKVVYIISARGHYEKD